MPPHAAVEAEDSCPRTGVTPGLGVVVQLSNVGMYKGMVVEGEVWKSIYVLGISEGRRRVIRS